MTRVGVEPKLYDQSRRNNVACTLSSNLCRLFMFSMAIEFDCLTLHHAEAVQQNLNITVISELGRLFGSLSVMYSRMNNGILFEFCNTTEKILVLIGNFGALLTG